MKKSPWKLDPLFTPRSIAVIGASPNGGAGSIVLRNMQRLGYTGTVYPINPKYKEIFGYPCYASLRDLPAPADCAAVLLALITWSDANMAGCCFGGSKKQPFTLAGPHMANVLSFEDPTEPLTVGTIDDFISDYIERHPEAKVDYVHDEPAVRALCKQGAVAFLMPPFAKSDLFRGVVMGGVLPRKTFSMGHAEEKRYYIECRKITE